MEWFTSKQIATFCLIATVFFPNTVSLSCAQENSSFQKKNDYQRLWVKVDSLSQIGLSKSALSVVEEIYAKAKNENIAEESVKSLIHRLKFLSYTDQDASSQSIVQLNTELRSSRFPIQPILHSILATLYWSYYTANRWTINSRSSMERPESDDIRTWDLRRIVEQCIYHYNQSLADGQKLQATQVSIFDQIVIKGDQTARALRPTLYDFLSHRAIDFFINQEHSLVRPAQRFEVSDPAYFTIPEKFAHFSIASSDTFSLELHGLTLLKNLTAFHLQDRDPSALIDVTLKRLAFVHEKSTLEGKDSLYLHTLQTIQKMYQSKGAHAHTEITAAIASFYINKGKQYKPLLSDTGKWLLVKARDLCSTVIHDKNATDLAHKTCLSLKAEIEQKEFQFYTEQVQLPSKPFRGLITYKNLQNAYFRIVRIDPGVFQSIERIDDQNQKISSFLKQKNVQEWRQELKNDGDYQTHTTEIALPPLPAGFYLILCSTDKKFSIDDHNIFTYSPCWATTISTMIRPSPENGTEYYVLDRSSGKPLPNVVVQQYLQSYDYDSREFINKKGDRFTTDKDGRFILPPTENPSNYYLQICKASDTFNTDFGYNHRPYKNEKRKEIRTVFFTDRAIYRPGQTIYFKGMVLQTDGDETTIVPSFKTSVLFKDVNYQKIEERAVASNEFGTFSGTFTAPKGVLTGQMWIGDNHGGVNVQIEEYKRPKFEVVMDTLKGQYRLDDEVTVTGVAKAYAGSFIDHASVKYRITRRPVLPPWYFWWWGGIDNSSPEIELTSGVTRTDEKGAFALKFIAIPDRSMAKTSSPYFAYQITVDVTDMNGETHSTEKNISLGYASISLSLNIPQLVENGEKQRFSIQSTNSEGAFTPTEGQIEIFRLQSPNRLLRSRLWNQPDRQTLSPQDYEKNFPFDLYADEANKTKWPRQQKVFSSPFSTGKDSIIALSSISTWQPAEYVAEATAKDRSGQTVSVRHFFTLYAKNEKSVPVNSFDWFVAPEAAIEVGGTASFTIGSQAKDVSVLYEIEHKNRIVGTQWLKLSQEQKTVLLPITAAYRGNVSVHFTFIKENRAYCHDVTVSVPYTNKDLDITFATFRNKLLPGQKEEWKVVIAGKKGEKAAAEMVAAMYDASLDAFMPHSWSLNTRTYYGNRLNWELTHGFSIQYAIIMGNLNPDIAFVQRAYDELNLFGFSIGGYAHVALSKNKSDRRLAFAMDGGEMPMSAPMAAPPVQPSLESSAASGKMQQVEQKKDVSSRGKEPAPVSEKKPSTPTVTPRTNLQETAFFYPHLQTNEKGEILFSFTMPEALTRWHFMGLGHTRDLKTGQIDKEVVTQKELMVMPNQPRFFREGDTIIFVVKIVNLSSADMMGTAQLTLFNSATMKPVDGECSNTTPIRQFSAKKDQSVAVSWNLIIPSGIPALTYRVTAQSGAFSDGEEMIIPVLTNSMLVTEALPLPIRGKQTKNFQFKNFKEKMASPTLRNFKMTLEFTANPAWYAVTALPYMMEYPFECAEQVFSRYYANSIATQIANSSPKIKQIFETWKNISPDVFLSNLQKNQQLKEVLLEETPWVLDALDESQRKRNVGLLFDLNHMAQQTSSSLMQLAKMQLPDGSWPWFPGMPASRYITAYIACGMGKLGHLGIQETMKNNTSWQMTVKAIGYLDAKIAEDYQWLVKHSPKILDSNHIGSTQIYYLYTRSFFVKQIPIPETSRKAVEYYSDQAQKYWLSNSRYLQGMIALALARSGVNATPAKIIASLKENAILSDEMGMYWNDIKTGYYWHQAPIETMALLLEAFDEVGKDSQAVDEIKTWLLKNKQTNSWNTTKATAEACYGLLLRGTDWLTTESDVTITVADKKIDSRSLPSNITAEAGSGYFTTSWPGNEITPAMGAVTVKKGTDGVAWGALYWQYFEHLDKISAHETPLRLKKSLFTEKNTATGPVITALQASRALTIGEKVIVRIELRVDRDMEFVHLKDMRAAGLEPINVLSTYKYQDGLGYYEATKDASTNFFFGSLPKGTYVFEYPLRVNQSGNFSNGISTIQCMYAPEFSAHSEGMRVRVGQ
ncbi:MAG: hypothetical protein JW795_14330 [Chitinivibrionales bacterium]|nr:hypothetical protein [Chitinivibrionales bacterium]